MRAIIIYTVLTGAVMTCATMANAADDGFHPGFYAGFGLGVTDLDVEAKTSRSNHQTDKVALKLFGGYQLTENFGIEGGYFRTGHIEVTDIIDGADITRKAKTRTAFLVGTGRMPVTGQISLVGRLGMAYGDVNKDADVAPLPGTIYGSKSSFTYGVGIQYALSSRTAVSLDFDHLGKESSQVSAEVLSLSVRWHF